MHRALACTAAVLASLTFACITSPPKAPDDTVWAKADGGYAAYGDFERAEAACGGSEGSLPDVSAGPRSRRSYATCMKAQGWERVRLP